MFRLKSTAAAQQTLKGHLPFTVRVISLQVLNPKGGGKAGLYIQEGVASTVAPPSLPGLLDLGRKATSKVPGLLLLEGRLLSCVQLCRRDQPARKSACGTNPFLDSGCLKLAWEPSHP